MNIEYWHKQTADQPLYPGMLWSRPENRSQAGKLLIVGGNQYGFVAPAEAYKLAEKAGAGSVRMLLPDSLRPFVGKVFTAGELAPSTPSGSFATAALAELLAMANWADGTLLAGDMGRNSETAILLERFLQKHPGQVTLTKDALEYVTLQPQLIRDRSETLLVLSYSQLRKLGTALKLPQAFTFDIDLLRLIDLLHNLSEQFPFAIITRHLDTFFVAVNGQVTSTPCPSDEKVWRLPVATAASVWWLQNPSHQLAALSTAIIDFKP